MNLPFLNLHLMNLPTTDHSSMNLSLMIMPPMTYPRDLPLVNLPSITFLL